ncbi:MAG TPA: aldo/keto reductase [Pirellulales bacterium]|nr:aldo/keto reductase [Pirellulales bacterium]
MKYRILGTTGLRVSVVGLGTWQLGGEWGHDFSVDEVTQLLAKAHELGINLLDTAECYGDHLSESLIGQALARLGQRDDWVIATKFGHRFHSFMSRTDERDIGHVRQQLDDSLKALRTDRIDLYQFHSVRDSEFFNSELWTFLGEAKKAGKVRHIGNSIAAALDPTPQAKASREAGVEALQVVFNRLDRRPETTALPIAREQNLGVLARVPLASGYLSGKYKPGTTFAGQNFRATQDPAKVQQMLTEVQQIAASEVPPGMEMAQWALAWCLKNPAVSTVIPGCKSVEQVESNARAAELVP